MSKYSSLDSSLDSSLHQSNDKYKMKWANDNGFLVIQEDVLLNELDIYLYKNNEYV